ncbi:DUF721 domain-containing protein [Candidatus Peregrinibacteria bacterium]|nr:DUF721 domain-containing protein [Candidatus Peregrinibacteria bacterium]
MFTPIQKILPKAITGLKFTRQARAALVCEKYRKLAPQIVHPEALRHTYPKFFKGTILVVAVENSAWAGQIAANKEKLLNELNKTLGKKEIKNIKTAVLEKM